MKSWLNFEPTHDYISDSYKAQRQFNYLTAVFNVNGIKIPADLRNESHSVKQMALTHDGLTTLPTNDI